MRHVRPLVAREAERRRPGRGRLAVLPPQLPRALPTHLPPEDTGQAEVRATIQG